MPRPRVLIVEDDPTTLERLAALVESHDAFELFGRAASLHEARGLIAGDMPDVLLTDLGLPDGSGIELIAQVAAASAGTEIAVMTVFADEGHVLRAIEAGATGYLIKDGNDQDVITAIGQLVRGESPISPSIARHVLRRLVPGGRSEAAGAAETASPALNPDAAGSDKPLLTDRETDVLRQIAKGFSYDEIAAALGISVHTVTTHIKNIYRKLAVRSRGEAVFEAMQLGLIRVDSKT